MRPPRMLAASVAIASLAACGVDTQDEPVPLDSTTPSPECVPEVSELTTTASALPSDAPGVSQPADSADQCD